jgi:hypothetical protein
MARIRAVLVGVDEYEHPDIPPLAGCVNDVALVRWTLKTCFGVPNEDIRVVVNRRATKANVIHRLETAFHDSEEGDVVLFYFSGHGSQVRDRDGDELMDSLDEILCPYDMDWDSATYILDDDLDAIFADAPAGTLLEAVMDCCFWGAHLLDLEAESEGRRQRPELRYVHPPFDIAARYEGDEERLDYHGFPGCDCFRGQNVLWAAAGMGQIAAEAPFDGRVQGVFSYWGCQFLAANIDRIWRRGYSRENLLHDVRAYFHSLGYAQRPELAAPWPLLEEGPFTYGEAPAWLGYTAADEPHAHRR